MTILAQIEDTIRFGDTHILRRWWRRKFSTGSFEFLLLVSFQVQTLSSRLGLVHRPSNDFIAWSPAHSGLTSIILHRANQVVLYRRVWNKLERGSYKRSPWSLLNEQNQNSCHLGQSFGASERGDLPYHERKVSSVIPTARLCQCNWRRTSVLNSHNCKAICQWNRQLPWNSTLYNFGITTFRMMCCRQ